MTERAAVISGIGQSDVGRRLYRHPLDLTVDAALDAIEDAGLTRDDIDGLATYPGNMDTPPGFSGVGVVELQDALRLDLDWYNGGLENPGQFGSVITACAAVAAGYANHVLCFRTVTDGSAQGDKGRASVTMGGGGRGGSVSAGALMQWPLPIAATTAATWIALCPQPPCSGRAPTSPRPTSTWPSSTTASASSPWPGSRPSGSARRAKGDRSSRAAPASPATARSPSTPTAANSRPAACTATASCTRRACSSAARVAT